MTFAMRVLASLATVAAGVGFMAFATFGAFDESNSPFPHSVQAVTATE